MEFEEKREKRQIKKADKLTRKDMLQFLNKKGGEISRKQIDMINTGEVWEILYKKKGLNVRKTSQ